MGVGNKPYGLGPSVLILSAFDQMYQGGRFKMYHRPTQPAGEAAAVFWRTKAEAVFAGRNAIQVDQRVQAGGEGSGEQPGVESGANREHLLVPVHTPVERRVSSKEFACKQTWSFTARSPRSRPSWAVNLAFVARFIMSPGGLGSPLAERCDQFAVASDSEARTERTEQGKTRSSRSAVEPRVT